MPALTDLHIDAALTNVSVKYANSGFISDIIAPRVMVNKKSDKYYILDSLRDELRQDNTSRAPGTPANVADFAVSNDNYACIERSLRSTVTDEDRANVDPAIQADIEKTEFLTKKLMIDQEIKLAAALSTAITNTAAPSVKWDVNTSDPIADVKVGILSVVDNIQQVPDILTLPYEVFLELKDHPLMIERVKAGGSPGSAAVVNEVAMAQVFGVPRVVVAKAYKNTSAKGAAASASNVWSTTCYLLVVPPRPGLRTVSTAYQFTWNFQGGTNGMVVRKWYEQNVRADIIEASVYDDRKIVAAASAYKLTSTLT